MTEPTVWTVNKILQWTQQYFSGKGLENPRLDAEVLLCDVLDCRRIDLFMRLQQELLPEELKKYREFVLRRAAWEPLAYIIGRKTSLALLEKEAFWRKKAEEARAAAEKARMVSEEKLREETDPEQAAVWQQEVADREAVASQTAERAGLLQEDEREKEPTGHRGPDILDIGTGSGAILLSLLKLLPESRGLAVDIFPEALAVAKENAGLLGVSERVWFRQSDFWSGVPQAAQFDIVVSNPPYIPAQVIGTLARDVQKEPRLALDGGADGLSARGNRWPGCAGRRALR